MQSPLKFIFSILKQFYKTCDPSYLIQSELVDPRIVEDLIGLYRQETTHLDLKDRILSLLSEFTSLEYCEMHFEFNNAPFFRQVKEDMLRETEKESERRIYYEFVEAAVEFFRSIFSFNDYVTNSSICTDLEFQIMFYEGLVRNMNQPRVGLDDPGGLQVLRPSLPRLFVY